MPRKFMKLISKFLKNSWPLILILLVASLVLSYNINKPFWGHHDWTGVYWGAVARNFARYGPITTRFGMILNSGPVSPNQFIYNFHYLPLFPIIWAGFFATLGVYDWVSRLMAIIFSLGAMALFYQLTTRYFSKRIAIFASLFWIATPMFIYFGKMPFHETPLMFFVLSAVYFYLQNRYRPMLVFILLAELTTWPGFFLVPAISFHWWFVNHKSFKFNSIVGLWIISVLLFLMHLTHDYLVTGSLVGGGLGEIFLSRIQGVAVLPYISVLVRWTVTYYTLLLPLSIIWLLLLIRRKLSGHQDIPALFLIYAVFYPLVFRDASYRHDYLLIYFWPFLTLSSAIAIEHVIRSKVLQNLAVVTVILIMVATRFKFIMALENSDIYKESVRFGQFIHDNSSPKDKVLALSADQKVPWDGWFIAYYADRDIVQQNTLPNDTKSFDRVMVYSPGGKMSIGADIKSNGIK